MPGLVVFRRRWSVGSDDLVVPGAFLFTMHLIWTVVLVILQFLVHFDKSVQCILLLWSFIVGYLVILVLSMAIEITICIVAMRGSILNTTPRSKMRYVLYIRLAVMFLEAGWLSSGIAWLVIYYKDCSIEKAKETVLGLVVCNWCILLSVIITVWCTYDIAGRSWVKMKKYQRSMRESESKFNYKRSGSTRNWRQRKVLRAYQDSWHSRCRFLFCCYIQSDRNRNSFADIARLLSDFFRDLDIVPSDVIAGLVLLRKFQKIERKSIVEQQKNDTYEFLSGVAITPRTRFLSLHEGGADAELFQRVIHFAHFAVQAYGWPVYLMRYNLGLCKLCPNLACCCLLPCRKAPSGENEIEIVNDNCCQCNYATLQKLTDEGDIEIIYATYHVDIGETPFYVAIDYDRKKIVISVRGTLSMKDILTDLNAEGETIPLTPIKEDWVGHKGMVQAAQYIYSQLYELELIEKARNHNPGRGTLDFKLVTVGHSLGAGTACILGILLRQKYTDLKSYCYSPPGGLLSMPAVEYSKEFTISVVVGKDVVPRIGLHQMEALRGDLINAIKRSVDPKWKTIMCSICCGCIQPTSAVEMSAEKAVANEYMSSRTHARASGSHLFDSRIALTSHQPLYPPGRIIHVVRHHPNKQKATLAKHQPVYQALWANNIDFDEVLISPVMLQDHLPDKVLDALNKVITTLGPRKPQRTSNNNGFFECALSRNGFDENCPPETPNTAHRLYLETSFTSLQNTPGVHDSNASSVTNGYYSAKSQNSVNIISVSEKELPMFATSTSIRPLHFRPPKAKSLSLNLKPTSPCQKIDLIHDDWFGLAPLASPESLSELSIISSMASLIASCDKIHALDKLDGLHTPKTIRRTLKIVGNLSTCADDVRNVRNFELAPKFRRKHSSDNYSLRSSSNGSFESASHEILIHSSSQNVTQSMHTLQLPQHSKKDETSGESDDFQSAEDILDNVMISAGCKDFFSSTGSTFLETHFDLIEPCEQGSCSNANTTQEPKCFQPEFQERFNFDTIYGQSIDPIPKFDSPKLARLVYETNSQLLSPTSPLDEVDTDLLTNYAIDLNLQEQNRSMQVFDSKSTSIDSGSVCRTPSDCKNVHFNPEVINIDPEAERSPLTKKRWSLIPFRTRNVTKLETSIDAVPKFYDPPKTILCTKRRNSDDSLDFFSRTEALPLLSGLSSNLSENISPGFVRRKKYVYPSDIAVLTKSHESNV